MAYDGIHVKRRQHYVWRKYLEAWARGEQLWCAMNGRRFQASTQKVAVERDFYRFEDVTLQDFETVSLMINQMLGPDAAKLAATLIAPLKLVFAVRDLYEKKSAKNADLDARMDHASNDVEEDVHTMIETMGAEEVNAMRRGDETLFSDGDRFAKLAIFLALQLVRTPGMAHGLKQLKTSLPINVVASAGLIRMTFGAFISTQMLLRQDTLRITYLSAPEDAQFVTSDQPTINLHAVEPGRPDVVRPLDLYYPLSPQRALLIEFGKQAFSVSSQVLTREEAFSYNDILARLSFRQVYAASEGDLSRLPPPSSPRDIESASS